MKRTRAYEEEDRERIVRLREGGATAADVTRFLGISERSQRRFLHASRRGRSLKPHPQEHSLTSNPNAKITPLYLELLEIELTEHPFSTDSELSVELLHRTGIELSSNELCYLRGRLGYTLKKATTSYVEADSEKNKRYRRIFLSSHRHGRGEIEFCSCASTDQTSFDNNIRRIFGKSRIRNAPYDARKVHYGRTRVKAKVVKHSLYRVCVAATLCVDKRSPIYFRLQRHAWNGPEFSVYVQQRRLPRHITHDLLDGSGEHWAVKTCQV